MLRWWYVQARLNHVGLSATRLALIASVFITVYFSFTIIGNQVHQYQLDGQNQLLEQRIAAQRQTNARLDALKAWMQSDAYIEAVARKQGMLRPGDHPVVVTALTPVPRVETGSDWWDRYFAR